MASSAKISISSGEFLLQSNPHRSRHTSGTEGRKVSFHVIMTKERASKRVQGSAERDISLEIEEGIGFCPFLFIVHICMSRRRNQRK